MRRTAGLLFIAMLASGLWAGRSDAANDRMSGTLPKSDIATDPANAAAEDVRDLRETEPASGPVMAEAVDIAKDVGRIESLGTLATFRQGGLGSDIWTGTRRSSLLSLLPQVPSATGSVVITDLVRRALLTEASASGIRNDVRVRPGQDFITLRLESLLRQGGYQDALDLYSLIREKPYTARLGKAGITAMLYTGNVALACLEAKSIADAPSDDAFWRALDAWCGYIAARDSSETAAAPAFSFSKILNGIAKDKNYRFPLRDLRELQDLSPVERAALVSESRFDYSALKGLSAPGTPSDCLTLPLYDKALPSSLKLQIAAEGVRRGVKPVQYLVELYRDIAPPNASPPAIDPGNRASVLLGIPFLFRTADRNPREAERWSAIQSALDLRPLAGWAPLLPFAEIVRDLNPGSVSPQTAGRVAEIIMRAGYTIPSHWAAKLPGADPDGASSPAVRNDLLRQLAARIASEDKSVPDFVKKALPVLDSGPAQTVAAIAEGLGLTKTPDSGKTEPYVNILPLTQAKDYVMPSFEVLDDLDTAVNSQTPGDVILLSALAMNETEPEKAYPGTIRKILAGYEAVGLHHEARKLAVEAVLGLVN